MATPTPTHRVRFIGGSRDGKVSAFVGLWDGEPSTWFRPSGTEELYRLRRVLDPDPSRWAIGYLYVLEADHADA